jgi:hypothetical protein
MRMRRMHWARKGNGFVRIEVLSGEARKRGEVAKR